MHDAPGTAPDHRRAWSPATRIAFRFVFVYFGLYVVTTQMLASLLVLPIETSMPQIGERAPLRTLTEWSARRVFGVTQPLVVTGSGSGDKIFDWVQAFCLLSIAIVATLVWSAVDRRRPALSAVEGPRHERLHAWFVLFLRFALGATMITYGAVKIIPLQMPAPTLTRLVEPFGFFSPMGVLWYSIGASRPYEMFTGSVEMLAGILLFVPRLATLGAMIALAASTQIFALNMTYDVPVKLFSFQLILMSLVLLAPEARRLLDVVVRDRAVPAPSRAPLLANPRAMRWLAIGQLVFGAYIIGMHLFGATRSWSRFGGGAPKPALYGIWNVDEMTVDGVVHPALTTDATRWRRVIVQSGASVTFQRMNDTVAVFPAAFDAAARTVTLKNPDATILARLVYEQPGPGRLVLEGDMNGGRIRLTTHALDLNGFLLLSRGFHWVQEYPFNR